MTMDPDTNLREALRLADELLDSDAHDLNTAADWRGDAVRLAELVLSLDGWLRGRGFLPERWRVQRRHMGDL